ncbi:hypothetical protein KSF78_0004882 [Schistosoma japonicum]|nr:hypothetical protein KSF78_0004882 [Schistosoma japonicum]
MIKQLNDVDMETGSKNHKNRGKLIFALQYLFNIYLSAEIYLYLFLMYFVLTLNTGFDYKVAKEKYSHAQRMKKICLDNAWDKCLLAVKANLEYEQVKDTNSSSMKKEILEKKERSLKKALENLITQVKFFNTQMFNYFKFLEPIERVNTVVELMESEVEYNIVILQICVCFLNVYVRYSREDENGDLDCVCSCLFTFDISILFEHNTLRRCS